MASNLWATDADLKDYAATTSTRISLTLDASGEVVRAFGVHGIPAVVTFDAHGRVARVRDAEAPDLASALSTTAFP